MQEVMMHPWFRMINPDINTLGNPAEAPENIRPPLPEELDTEIVLHMRWLLAPGPSHSDPEFKEVFNEELLLREIEEKLVNSEENMERLFYRLLSQHKTEILKNHSGDENESRPDGPRRRAGSFLNSAASIRSSTFDFSRASRFPPNSLTLPGSPLFPTTRISCKESPPLTLSTKETAVARNPAGSTNTTRPSIPVSSRPEKPAAISSIALRKQEAGITTTNNGEPTKEPQPAITITELEENATILYDVRSEMSSHLPVKAWKPGSPAVLCSPVINDSNDIVVDMNARQEQDVVLSTRISDFQPLPVLEAKENANPTTAASANGPNADVSGVPEIVSRTRPKRPILRPLDVKASACTTATSQLVRTGYSGTCRNHFKNLHNDIQVKCYKKLSLGLKCRYQGGVIDNQPVNGVKFKVEVAEKAGHLISSASNVSNNSNISNISNISNTNNHFASSSAAAAILATVDLRSHHPNRNRQSHVSTGNAAPTSNPVSSSGVVGRRASDGGSILLNAAPMVSTQASTTAKRPQHHTISNNGCRYLAHHYAHHLSHSFTPNPVGGIDGTSAHPSHSCPSNLPRRTVRVILHQQKGANSTLKMIFDYRRNGSDKHRYLKSTFRKHL
ncbi:hypothetical protein BGX34_011216 [Mortierella sp. NVP85]|nr:hypothetical protein BGX34_011216 [Mortierella sp. NVP85]